MTIAYWCVLIAAFLPYLWVTVAKASGQSDVIREPRAWQARQVIPRSNRAIAAQMNAFESFAPFAASVLMAQLAGVDPARISVLGIADSEPLSPQLRRPSWMNQVIGKSISGNSIGVNGMA